MKTKATIDNVLAVARPTFLCAVPTLVGSGLVMLVAGVFAMCNRKDAIMLSLSCLVLFVALFVLLSAVLRAWVASLCNKYTFTAEAVSTRTGFFSTKTVEVKVADIRGVSVRRSLFGRLLGYATAEIGTAATAGAEIQISNVRNLDAILARLEQARAGK